MTDSSDASPQHVRWHPVESTEALAETVARRVLAVADRAIAERGSFTIVLAGGNTPRAAYALLRDAAAAWSGWHVYFGDERCAPRDARERNSRMAEEAWLGSVPIPVAQVHPIAAELGPIQKARDAMRSFWPMCLRSTSSCSASARTAIPRAFFPVTKPASPPTRRMPCRCSRHPSRRRCAYRSSARRLARARHVFFLVAGADKGAALARWRAGATIPAARIRPQSGVDVFVATSGALA